MAKKNTFDGLRSKDHNFSLDTPLYVNTDPWRRNEETDGFPMRDAPLPPPELPPKVSQLPPKSSQLRAIKSPPMGTSTPKSPGELSPSVDVSSPLQLVSCSSQSEIKVSNFYFELRATKKYSKKIWQKWFFSHCSSLFFFEHCQISWKRITD